MSNITKDKIKCGDCAKFQWLYHGATSPFGRCPRRKGQQINADVPRYCIDFVKKDCSNCAHYQILKDGTLNRDHEEELRECDLPGVEDFFNEDGMMKEPDKPWEYVDCDEGQLQDECDFFNDKAKHCPSYKEKVSA